MPIEIGNITLSKIHRLETVEQAAYARHLVPGLDGSVVQNLGRKPVQIWVEGIFYGETAVDDLEALRDVYKKREPIDFLAEVVGQAYFAEVVLDRFEVHQLARDPGQFSYRILVVEYTPPPPPVSLDGLPELDLGIELEALDFMDMLQLPDLLSAPEIGDPTVPLSGALDELDGALEPLDAPSQEMGELFGEDGSDSLFGQVENGAPDDAVEAQLQGQVDQLANAGEELDSLENAAPAAVADMQSAVSDLPAPEIGSTDGISSGYGELENVLPTDPTSVTAPVGNQIDAYFSQMGQQFTGPLSGTFEGLKKLGELGNLGLSEDASEGETPGVPQSRSLSGGPAPNKAIEALRNIHQHFDKIPDPLDAVAMMHWALAGLRLLPRERYPLRYLPVLDELRDKLETVLAWNDLTAAELVARLTEDTRQLDTFVQNSIFNAGIGRIVSAQTDTAAIVDLSLLENELPDLRDDFQALASAVQSDERGTAASLTAALNQRLDRLTPVWAQLHALTESGTFDTRMNLLARARDRIESEMLHVLTTLNPPSDLDLLQQATQPVDVLLQGAGITEAVDAVGDFLDKISGLFQSLNLAGLVDTVNGAVDTAVSAVDGLNDLLTQATVEITRLLNQAENLIEQIDVAGKVEAMRQALVQFTQFVRDQITRLFQPIRDLLIAGFQQLMSLLERFDPRKVVEALMAFVSQLTDVLSDPQLLDQIEKLRSGLDEINVVVGGFSFKPVTDKVVTGISVAKSILEKVGALPMPDSLKDELRAALQQLPPSLHPAVDRILEALNYLLENGPVPLLEALRDKPAEFITLVEQYSPDKLIGDRLSEPYQAFLDKLESYKPSEVVKPVQEQLNTLKDQLSESIQPTKLLAPLNDPFDRLMGLFDQIDPHALVEPLQEKLTEGINTLIDALPLDAANEAFDQIEAVTDKLYEGIETAECLRDLLDDLRGRVAGLAGAEQQVRNFGTQIATRIEAVNDISELQTAWVQLEQTLDQTRAASLASRLAAPLEPIRQQLDRIDARPMLESLVSARLAVPRSTVETWNAGGDARGAAVIALLDRFEPLSPSISEPMDALDRWQALLNQRLDNLSDHFEGWDDTYHGVNSPLAQWRQSQLSASEFVDFLKNEIETRFTDYVAPLFGLIDHFVSAFDQLVDRIDTFITDLSDQIRAIASVGAALDALRDAFNRLVDRLRNFDITFLADEVEDIFDAFRQQLEAISPAYIAQILDTAFQELLSVLDLNALLGLPALDTEHKRVIDFLRERDPKVLIEDLVQPEFDKVIAFLRLFDLSEPIGTFLGHIEGLEDELSTELHRVADAYEGMVDVIPSDLQGALQGSVSINVTATVAA